MINGDVSTIDKQADIRPEVELQPHQEDVVDKIQGQLDKKNKARMLLYHSLGSGKTLSGLAAAEESKIPYTAVVPAALRTNLRKEQERFIDPATAVPSHVMSHTGMAKGDPVVNPESILVDEAHRFRNPGSAQSQNLLNAAAKAKKVVLLSGTPIVNSPGDFAVPYSILTGKDMDPDTFSNLYVDSTTEVPWYKRVLGYKPEGPKLKNVDVLKRDLAGKIDYFAPKKPDIEVNREDVITEMGRDQTDIYNQLYGKLPRLLKYKLQMNYPLSDEETKNMISFLTGPRQVSLSPLTFMGNDKDPLKAFDRSPKLTEAFRRLNDLIKTDPKGKALVFSNFIEAGLSPYLAALNKAGIPAASFTGALSDKERKKLVDDYNADKLKVALLGPAGTEGLSFKGTKLVQLLDPHWHSTRGSQSEGRAIRFGSHDHLSPEERKVKIERYIARTAPGRLKSLLRYVGMSAEPQPATDDYLIEAAAKKQKLNDEFLDLLKEIGSSRRN